MTDWTPLLELIGKLAVLTAGIRVLAMAWEAPQRASMPLILTRADIEQHRGSLRVRQVFLFFFGAGIIICAIVRLGT